MGRGIKKNKMIYKDVLLGENKGGEKFYLNTQIAYEEFNYHTCMYEMQISNFVFKDKNQKTPYGNLNYFLKFYKEDGITLTDFGEKVVNGFIPGEAEYQNRINKGEKRFEFFPIKEQYIPHEERAEDETASKRRKKVI